MNLVPKESLVNTALAIEFLRWWFKPTDIIHFEPLQMRVPTPDNSRLTQAMPKHRAWLRMDDPTTERKIDTLLKCCDVLKAHAFFGVAPRELPDRQADMLHQIRRLPGCWADFDGTDLGTVLTRIKTVGLPEPSWCVMSGGGIHVYWKFDQEYVIDDAGQVEPIFYEVQGDAKYGTPCVKLPDGTKEWLGKRKIAPSPKCQAFIDLQAGLYTLLTDKAAKFKADSVQNPNRFLRIPGSVNHKYGLPVLSSLKSPHSQTSFAQLSELTKAVQPTKSVDRAFVPDPKGRKFKDLGIKLKERLSDLMINLNNMGVGQRSDKAFELLCLMHESGIKYDEAMHLVMKIKVFEEKGEKWFDRTWEAAVTKHQDDYLGRIDKAKAQAANREGLGPAPVVQPQQENHVEKMWEQNRILRAQKMCQDLRFDVVGEKGDGTVLIFSRDKGKTDEIKDVGRLQIARLNQAVGDAAASRLTTVATDAPGQYSITEARELIGLLAGKFQITNESYMGTGIWPVKDKGSLTGEVLLVNGSRSAVYNPTTTMLTRLTSPRYKDAVVNLEGQVENPWFEHDALQASINSASDPKNRQRLTAAFEAHFKSWRWADGAYSPALLTGLVLAAFVQTCWPWRPLVAIMGAAASGKTLLMQQLQALFGPLAFGATHATEAAVRQGMGNQAKVIFSDEFEASGRRASFYELLRTSSRGDHIIRGTAAHKMQKFGLKHIPFLASIELGLEREPDKSRFIQLELERNPPTIALWDQAKLDTARNLCLGIALRCLPTALAYAQAMADTHATDGADRRLIDNLAVPVAMGLAAHGLDPSSAVDLFGKVLQAKATEAEDTDDQAMLAEILSLLVDLGQGQKRTVAELLVLGETSAETHLEALARQYGIAIVPPTSQRGRGHRLPKASQIPREDQWLFICGGKIKSTNALRNTRFDGQNPNELLKRVCPKAEHVKMQVASTYQWGILLPMPWLRENFIS